MNKFYVVQSDGERLGPCDVSTLIQWADVGRIQPHTMLEDSTNGERFPVSQLLERNIQRDGSDISSQSNYPRPATTSGIEGRLTALLVVSWILCFFSFCYLILLGSLGGLILALYVENNTDSENPLGAKAAKIANIVALTLQGLFIAYAVFIGLD